MYFPGEGSCFFGEGVCFSRDRKRRFPRRRIIFLRRRCPFLQRRLVFLWRRRLFLRRKRLFPRNMCVFPRSRGEPRFLRTGGPHGDQQGARHLFNERFSSKNNLNFLSSILNANALLQYVFWQQTRLSESTGESKHQTTGDYHHWNKRYVCQPSNQFWAILRGKTEKCRTLWIVLMFPCAKV